MPSSKIALSVWNKIKIKNDINNLLELNNFPCQLNDFSDLIFSINNLNKWDERFSFTDLLENVLVPDEYLDCLVEGMCINEEILKNVFIVLTTKRILFYCTVTDKSVKKIKSIDINSLQTLFLDGREIIMIISKSESKSYDKFEIKLGFDDLSVDDMDDIKITVTAVNKMIDGKNNTSELNKMRKSVDNTNNTHNTDAGDDRTKEFNKKFRNINQAKTAFYFCVSIWRIYFINNFDFLKILKIPDKNLLVSISLDKLYLDSLYKSMIDNKIDFIKKQIEKLLIEESALKLNRKETKSKQKEENFKPNNIEEQEEIDLKKKNIDRKFDGITYFLYDNPKRSHEFIHPTLKYTKVILKIYKNYIALYDIINEEVSFINLKLISHVLINSNRFVLVIYFYPKEELRLINKPTDKEKIVLYNHTNNDLEYNFFRIFLIQILEYNRLNVYSFSVIFDSTESILKKINDDGCNYYSISRNNLLIKSNENKSNQIDSDKFAKKDEVEIVCCCIKRKKRLRIKNIMTSMDRQEFLNNLGDRKSPSSCYLY